MLAGKDQKEAASWEEPSLRGPGLCHPPLGDHLGFSFSICTEGTAILASQRTEACEEGQGCQSTADPAGVRTPTLVECFLYTQLGANPLPV